jgi:hypothetical protein
MPDWTVLKDWMASCWKVSWKVDPLPLSVPLRAALLLVPDEGLVVDVLVLDDELDEEHAARATAKTASPAVVTCRLRRRCISDTPYRVNRVLGRSAQPGHPANRGVPVQSGGVAGTCE